MMMPLIHRVLPFLRWLPVRRQDLRADLAAGVAVALVAVPQSLAYAQLAGLPPVCGLYASFLPVIVAALFGSCPPLACGPTALSALLTASVLVPLAAGGSDPAMLGAWLALLCGGLLLVGGALRLGGLVNLLSQPVMKGFTNAAALLIALSQLGSILGVELSGSGLLPMLAQLPAALLQANPVALAVSAAAAFLLLVGRRISPRFPSVLLAAALLTTAAWAGSLHEGAPPLGVVGAIPAGLPGVLLPDLQAATGHWGDLLSAAVAITLIIFVEVSSLSQALAAKTGGHALPDRQLVAQGLACLSGGVGGGYPVSASFSRSALCLVTGSRTPYVHLVSALVVLAVLLWLTPLLFYLPHAALGVIIVFAVAGLFDPRALRDSWRVSRADGLCHLITFLATLLLSPRVTDGIFLGVGLTLALHVRQLMKPRACLVEEDEQGQLCEAAGAGLTVNPVCPTLRFDGRLVFASAGHFRHSVEEALRLCPHARALLIAGESINEIDATGAQTLKQLCLRLRENGVRLVLFGMKPSACAALEHAGALSVLGEENLQPTRRSAFVAFEEASSGGQGRYEAFTRQARSGTGEAQDYVI